MHFPAPSSITINVSAQNISDAQKNETQNSLALAINDYLAANNYDHNTTYVQINVYEQLPYTYVCLATIDGNFYRADNISGAKVLLEVDAGQKPSAPYTATLTLNV